MPIKTDFTFKLLNVIAWIIFIGLCVEAGGFIFKTFFTLILEPDGTNKFWTEINLFNLYNYNQSHFVTVAALLIIVAVMKALMFYIIVDIFHNKKLNLAKPFNEKVERSIFKIAYLALGIGLFSYWGAKFTQGLLDQGVKMTDLQNSQFGGADVWLFMGVVILVFAKVFEKGIELQEENELTI